MECPCLKIRPVAESGKAVDECRPAFRPVKETEIDAVDKLEAARSCKKTTGMYCKYVLYTYCTTVYKYMYGEQLLRSCKYCNQVKDNIQVHHRGFVFDVTSAVSQYEHCTVQKRSHGSASTVQEVRVQYGVLRTPCTALALDVGVPYSEYGYLRVRPNSSEPTCAPQAWVDERKARRSCRCSKYFGLTRCDRTMASDVSISTSTCYVTGHVASGMLAWSKHIYSKYDSLYLTAIHLQACLVRLLGGFRTVKGPSAGNANPRLMLPLMSKENSSRLLAKVTTGHGLVDQDHQSALVFVIHFVNSHGDENGLRRRAHGVQYGSLGIPAAIKDFLNGKLACRAKSTFSPSAHVSKGGWVPVPVVVHAHRRERARRTGTTNGHDEGRVLRRPYKPPGAAGESAAPSSRPATAAADGGRRTVFADRTSLGAVSPLCSATIMQIEHRRRTSHPI
ncbi:hypothetical protein RJ55_05551 [Drechmeria coniospora]|nr:hypothetical protein RJ55_05551 [Drechmeria coniospora]